MNTAPPNIPNHLVWAILTTLFCCPPLGIVSLINAAKVNSLITGGDYAGARAASDAARKWAIASAVAGPVLFVLYLLFAGGMGVMANLFNGG